jgi:hypothetical protein
MKNTTAINELEAMAAELSEQTGRSLDDCRNGLRLGMAKFLAATGWLAATSAARQGELRVGDWDV